MESHLTNGTTDANGVAGSPGRQLARGVVVATITPCSQQGVPDTSAAGILYRHLFAKGVNGVFVGSSTGEADLLDRQQRVELVRCAREAAGESHAVFAGISSTGTQDIIEFSSIAKEAGADFGVVMAPLFLKYSQAELFDYFTRIADESPLPIALYHHPRSSNPIEIDTIARLAEHHNITAVKDTSYSAARAQQLSSILRDLPVCLLQGSENLVLDSLSSGADGMVTALAGIAPEWHAALFDAWSNEKTDDAKVEQQRLTQLWQLFGIETVGATISNFTSALKLGLVRRGWLTTTAGMLSDIELPQLVTDEITKLFDEVELPKKLVTHSAHPQPTQPAAIKTSKSAIA